MKPNGTESPRARYARPCRPASSANAGVVPPTRPITASSTTTSCRTRWAEEGCIVAPRGLPAEGHCGRTDDDPVTLEPTVSERNCPLRGFEGGRRPSGARDRREPAGRQLGVDGLQRGQRRHLLLE